MFFADMPEIPSSEPAVVMVAQNNTSRDRVAKGERVLGVCEVLNLNRSSSLGIVPVIKANVYFNTFDAKIDTATAKISILEHPQYGEITPNSRGDWWDARYTPNDGYLGQDTFVVQVVGNGYTIKLNYFIAVTDDNGETINPNPVCKGAWWRISKDANGNQVLTLVDSAASQTDAINAMWNTQFGAYGNVTLSFADLAGGAIGKLGSVLTFQHYQHNPQKALPYLNMQHIDYI